METSYKYMIKSYVEKCPICRRERENGEWIVRETEVTTSRTCPPCLIIKKKEFEEFLKTL